MRTLLFAFFGVLLTVSPAKADDDKTLFIYTWNVYHAQELYDKFEAETGIKVIGDSYSTNEMLVSKLKAGAGGYDIVMPFHGFVPGLIEEGLLYKYNAKSLPNFKYLDPTFVGADPDPEDAYSITYAWGTHSIVLNEDVYKPEGDVSWSILFEPPSALKNKVGMMDDMISVFSIVNLYAGIPFCSDDPENLRKIETAFQSQKPDVVSYSFAGQGERIASGDVEIALTDSGVALAARKDKPSLKYLYPKEGIMVWTDRAVIPHDAPHKENAVKFINWVMDPKNAAVFTNTMGYANAIPEAQQYWKPEITSSPEFNIPEGIPKHFTPLCKDEVVKFYDQIWTRLLR